MRFPSSVHQNLLPLHLSHAISLNATQPNTTNGRIHRAGPSLARNHTRRLSDDVMITFHFVDSRHRMNQSVYSERISSIAPCGIPRQTCSGTKELIECRAVRGGACREENELLARWLA